MRQKEAEGGRGRQNKVRGCIRRKHKEAEAGKRGGVQDMFWKVLNTMIFPL